MTPLISGHSDLAIGTRPAHGSRVVRGLKREIISRCYNVLLRSTLAVGLSDAQCGSKAVRREVAELLVIAERAGLRIHKVPVDWVDDPDSRVDLLASAPALGSRGVNIPVGCRMPFTWGPSAPATVSSRQGS